MTSSTLEGLPDHSSVFVDANIFIYHFTAASSWCHHAPRSSRSPHAPPAVKTRWIAAAAVMLLAATVAWA